MQAELVKRLEAVKELVCLQPDDAKSGPWIPVHLHVEEDGSWQLHTGELDENFGGFIGWSFAWGREQARN